MNGQCEVQPLCTGDEWWKVDLQAAYCLTRITVVNINVNGGRLTGAVVRAGLNSDLSQNRRIGAVTSSQATNGATIPFTSNQAISARYVSVELSRECLQLAEVRIGTENVITSVTRTNIDATSMTVSWSTLPCADHYYMEYALTNRDNCENINPPMYSSPCNMCQRNTATLYGLTPFSQYTIQVKAYVYGAYGPIKTVIYTTTSSAPTGPPTSVTPGSEAKRSLAFSWSLPLCGSRSGVITGYDWRLSTSGAAPMTGQTTTGLSGGAVTIAGLTPYTYYSFQVAARTNDGTGPYSAAVTSRTQEAAPTVPRNILVQSTDDMSVRLSWNEPDPPNGRITHYNVQYRRSGDMGTVWTDNNVMGTIIRVMSLEAAPTIPRNVRIQSTDDRSVSLSWSEPDPANGLILHYNVRYWRSEDMGTMQTDTNVIGLVHRVTGLEAFVTYTFRVQAETSPGAGPWSEPIEATTLQAAPTVPLEVSIQPVDNDSIILRWSEPDPPNGLILHYNVRHWRSGDMGTMQTDSNVMGMMHRVTGLEAGVTYQFQVQAVTSPGPGPWSDPIQATTSIGVPGPVRILNATERTETSITLVWEQPLQPGGSITGYIVEHRILQRPYQSDFTAMDTYTSDETRELFFLKTNLEPGTQYEFRVFAKNEMFTGSYDRVLEVYTRPKSDPPAPKQPKTYEEEATNFTVTIGLANLVSDDKYVSSYVVHVNKTSASRKSKRAALTPKRSADSADDYIAAEIPKQNLAEKFVVGDNETYESYRNAPLQTGADYEIRVGSVSKGNDEEIFVTYSVPIRVTVEQYQASPTPGPSPSAVVPAVVAVIVVVALVLLIIVVVYRRRRSARAKKQSDTDGQLQSINDYEAVVPPEEPKPSTTNTYMNQGAAAGTCDSPSLRKPKLLPKPRQPQIDPPIDGPQDHPASSSNNILLQTAAVGGTCDSPSMRKPKPPPKPQIQETKPPQPAQPPDEPGMAFTPLPPVRLEDLESYINMKESAGDKGFEADYKTLPNEQLHPWTVASKPENRKKNRYVNVIAYDHSRVVLQPLEGDPHSDYINACYINGYHQENKYIASQGPNQESIKDIWRMVWQLGIDKIVMLTNPVENGKRKCLQYWADTGPTTISGIVVNTDKEEVFLDYTIRDFRIREVGRKDTRLVKQFHYTTWPDMKPPEYPAPLLNFMRVVNAYQNPGRTVIHCSAGVGRTGTYIALEAMLEQMAQERQVDVLGFIYQMRQNRIKMVQTPEQYKFIFDALLASSQTGDTTYHDKNFEQKLTALKKPKKGSKSTGMTRQFEMLGKWSVPHGSRKPKSGLRPESIAKNRFKDFIPTDRARPYLMTQVHEGDNDYINANYLPSYRKKNGYIGTQMPMPSTVVDFWRMVYDHKVTSIVMLNALDPKDKTMARYWPESGHIEFGPLVIELNETEEFKGVSRRTFTLRNEQADFETEDTRRVTQFQYHDWPSDKEVPSSLDGMLYLLRVTQDSRQDKGLIVVHCKDGYGATSVYCVLMALLEQFNVEKAVDVFQAAHRLRMVDPNMMYSLHQYAMCYDVIQAYMNSTSIYENFTPEGLVG
ncbi:receptor-type tyrosine-protein phosphatase mu-like [Patiria miniata]|uniref:protein-tyrosine-phosphatase n=1 Tax=Patiria miniata TaxID=46514 RepID=A0A914AT80_PATMI|nr:receptor-type tyrosine-protein phosphatase mu-like [Patiria miniata]